MVADFSKSVRRLELSRLLQLTVAALLVPSSSARLPVTEGGMHHDGDSELLYEVDCLLVLGWQGLWSDSPAVCSTVMGVSAGASDL